MSIETWGWKNLHKKLAYQTKTKRKKRLIEPVLLITFLPTVARHRLGVLRIFDRVLFRYQLEMETNQKK